MFCDVKNRRQAYGLVDAGTAIIIIINIINIINIIIIIIINYHYYYCYYYYIIIIMRFFPSEILSYINEPNLAIHFFISEISKIYNEFFPVKFISVRKAPLWLTAEIALPLGRNINF
jgi:hypothetical protein